jgi:hypothetical protein
MEWADHYRQAEFNTEDGDKPKKVVDLTAWDQEFFKVKQEMLFEIIMVCFYS